MKKFRFVKIILVFSTLVFCVNAINVSMPTPAFHDPNNWNSANGMCMLSNNQIASNGCFLYYLDKGALKGKNFTYEVDVRVSSPSQQYNFGVVFNINSGMAKGVDFMGNQQGVAGYMFWDYRTQQMEIGSQKAFPNFNKNWIKVKVVHQNGTFMIYVNGKHQYTHRAPQVGAVGFYVIGCTIEVKNLKLYAR